MPIAIFDNQLHVVYEHRPSPVVYCGYLVKAGTRHEQPADEGMAHFLEHMSFKGTSRRSSTQISNYLERVGGDLNAFTNKQETMYCATVLSRDSARAVDLLTDIVFHSTYPQSEITKEVEVIVDEIDSYLDSPAELIFDEFEAMLFAGSDLGRDILGSPACLRSYTTADARAFAQAHYAPSNSVFYFYGEVALPKLVRWIEKAHHTRLVRIVDAPLDQQDHPAPHTAASAAIYAPPTLRRVKKSTTQAHVMLGAPTFGGNDSRRYALLLLNNMLGGPGMNSRLNMSVRERHGLVYSIDAYLNSYPDVGYWNVYFGCDKADIKRCLRLVHRELQRFATRPLSTTQLRSAKQQLIGQIGISEESFDSHAQNLAKSYAHYGTLRDLNKLKAHIEAVSATDIQQLAAEIYHPERISTLIYE